MAEIEKLTIKLDIEVQTGSGPSPTADIVKLIHQDRMR
jgi:hypothetical protein